MSKVKDAAKSSGAYLLGNIFNKIIGLIIVFILARYLGVKLFGDYSFTFVFIGLFVYLNDFGVAPVLLRKLSHAKGRVTDSVLVGKSMLLKAGLSLLAVFLVNTAAFLLNYPGDVLLIIFLYSLTILFGGVQSILDVIFRVHLKEQYNTITGVAASLFMLGSVVFIISTGGGLTMVFFAFALASLLSLLLALYFSRRFVSLRTYFSTKLFDPALFWKIIMEGWPFALFFVSLAVYNRIDVVLLSWIMGNEAVGNYSAAYRLTETLSIFANAMIVPLVPIMCDYFKKSSEALINAHNFGFKYILFLYVPVATATFFLGGRVMLLVFGQEFVSWQSALTLTILAWVALFIAINFLFLNLMMAIFREQWMARFIGLGIAMNIVLNILWIPSYSYLGAAFATLVTELVLFCLFIILIAKYLYVVPLGRTVKPLLASLGMAIFIFCFSGIDLILLILLSAVLYTGLFSAMRGFSEYDVDLFRRLLRRGTGDNKERGGE